MSTFAHISVTETRRLIAGGDVTLIDIRDPASFHGGHVEGALLLDNDTFGEFLETADRMRPVVVYCYHGVSSQSAAQYLVEQGFSAVYSMDGGYEAWRIAST